MSHEVVFLPHILGQTWAQALAAARTAAREEDPRIVAARLEPWPDLVLRAAQILGQIEEYRGRGQRELVHPVTRLRFTYFGEDAVIALPYWYDGPVARMAATMAFRFAHAVESDTGLAAYDPQQRTPLAEMGLEKFVAGYLRGRERALGQTQARGPVPVGHALPTGRSATRRELGAGPSTAGGSSAGAASAGASAGGGSAAARRDGGAPRNPDARPRGESGRPADARPRADAGRPTDATRLRPAGPRPNSDQRQSASAGRRASSDARQAADSGPIAGSGSGGWLRRGKPARGEQVPRPGKDVEPRKAPRRGESGQADPAQRPRRAADPDAPRRGDVSRAEQPQRPRRAPEADAPRRRDPDQVQRPGRVPDPDAPRRRDRDQAQRPGRVSEPRKPSRRERAEAEQAKRSRKPQRDSGSDWSVRPGRPEPPPPPEQGRRPPPDF